MGRLKSLRPRVALLEAKRRTATASGNRIRGSQLQAIRERVLSAEPRCVRCLAQGRVSAATEVDHIVALVNGGTDDPHDDSNRQGLCGTCHEEKTADDLAIARGQSAGLVGGW